jgi:hypothetical protein
MNAVPNMKDNPKRGRVAAYVLGIITGALLGTFIGYCLFYYLVLGIVPWNQIGMEPIVSENMTADLIAAVEDKSYSEVMAFINTDDTDKSEFGPGNNCVDYSVTLWRRSYWQGIQAYLMVIRFEDLPHHMIVGFNTTDRGWIFIEPQSDKQVYPWRWTKYDGRTIVGLYGVDMVPIRMSDQYPEWEFDATE